VVENEPNFIEFLAYFYIAIRQAVTTNWRGDFLSNLQCVSILFGFLN